MNQTDAPGPEDEAVEEALQSLLYLRSYDAFQGWVALHDPKLRSAVLRILLRKRSQPHGGLSYAAWLDLLVAAPADLRDAWEKREAEAKAVETFMASFDEELEPVGDLLARGDVEGAIAIYDRMIARGRSLRAGGQVGFLQKLRADLLQIRPEGSRADNLEDAIEALNEAISYARAGAPSLETMLELAHLYTEREVGDRVDNLAIASNLLREALGLASEDDPLELRGRLGCEFGKSLMRREDGDRRANLELGIEVTEEAIADLEAAGKPAPWIWAKLTLGGLLVNHARTDASSTEAGEVVFEEVIVWSAANDAPAVAAAAHHELARTKRTATHHSPLEIVEAIEAGVQSQLEERDADRQEAADHLGAAEELLGEDAGGIEIAQIRAELCLLLSRLEEDEEAIKAGRRALETLSPTRLTRLCFEVGFALAASFARRGEWHEAAQTYRSAVAASELIFRGLRDDDRRRDETRQIGELGRWAAFAFSMDGEPDQAATVLENMRTRELRRRLGLTGTDAGRLWELPGDLRRAYEAALAALAASPLSAGDEPGRDLRDALVSIRKLPGFEDFGSGERLEDLYAATEPGLPLLYVNPTPVGTVLILVDGSVEGEVRTRHLSEPSSTLVFMRLIAGSGYEEGSEFNVEEAGPSYLMAIGGIAREDPDRPTPAERDAALDEAIVDTLGWLGPALAQPIAELLREVGARGVTLVPCGPLSTVPLATAPWSTEDGSRCLLDEFEVRYAPSAALVRTSLARSSTQTSKEQCLVGLADPQENLPGARPELLEEIAALVDGKTDLAFGPAATSDFLRASAAGATHLHLACHAGGGLYELEAMVVRLADGDLAAMELGGTLESRLVVVSACQSALPHIAGPSGEAFATSTAFLAAGSACVIASLWSVDDLATAILMTRLYEEMFGNGHRPPEALRRAQLWLRELTYKDEAAFLTKHPQLDAEARRRDERGERVGASPSAAGAWLRSGRPFAHPRYWAPFIAIGT